ncbi:MAG TPA: hypothetical protein DSN98_08735 [Thermoplasmata archaeon]|jgi:chromosome segregation ATPase|nr:MAG TPA: hypothetical protein DSN98_08735 [Thermoplasmata archaeon]
MASTWGYTKKYTSWIGDGGHQTQYTNYSVDEHGKPIKDIEANKLQDAYYDAQSDHWKKAEEYIDFLQTRIGELEDELAIETDKPPVRVDVPAEMKKLEKQVQDQEKKILKLQETNRKLESNLYKEKQNCGEATSIRIRLERQYADVYETMEEKHKTLKDELTISDNRNMELKSTNDILKSDIVKLNKEIKRLKDMSFFPSVNQKKKKKGIENTRFSSIEVV